MHVREKVLLAIAALVLLIAGASTGAIMGIHQAAGNVGTLGAASSGVYGFARTGCGVYGTSTTNSGVVGEIWEPSAAGVYGINRAAAGSGLMGWGATGVQGMTGSSTGNGVHGTAEVESPFAYAIWGVATAPAMAGVFQGNVNVYGTLSKAAGSFRIDHPLAPGEKYLSHSFVESPDMKNIYDGIVVLGPDGSAEVELPAYFEALNFDFRYQLTCIGQHADVYIADEIENNRFRIDGGYEGLRVSWQVTGIRKDAYAMAHRIAVEEDKPLEQRGRFLYPVEHGAPPSAGVDFPRLESMRRTAGRRPR